MRKHFISWGALLLGGLLLLSVSVRAQDFTRLVEQTRAAVVNVSSQQQTEQSGLEGSPLEEFFKIPKVPRESRGSGFIISADGYVLTNTHVVKDAEEIYVSLVDRREYPAKVVGSDELSDIALLKIEPDGELPTVTIGNSDSIHVGQWVLAIGSPFGFDYTATRGIVSALGRSLPDDTYVPFIQTDAALNPGNSGGPLFNMQGEVVGVNSQIFTRSGGYMGLSFAIPINVAMHVVEQIKVSGKVARGWLGVIIQSVNSDLAKSFGLKSPRGALVSKIMPDSPAKEAGLQVGDIILSFDGEPISRHTELPSLVGMTAVGEDVPMIIRREGEEITLTATIAELSENPEQLAGGVSASKRRLKILVGELTENQKEELEDVEGGVVIKKVVSGPAAQAGLEQGDIILRLNHQPVRNVKQFEQLVNDLPTEKPISMLVQRAEGRFFLALTLPEKDRE